MILGYNPVWQALLGTLLTWGLTAAGSALVFIFSSRQRQILDGSLGFAAGFSDMYTGGIVVFLCLAVIFRTTYFKWMTGDVIPFGP